ncbi:hypothetical protein FBQ97_06405 [Acidobacteria bacterium ACD]|nr:MAG: hypothetical protein EDX89_04425 [Acidobacteriota bacterium]MCE7960521.1 hypothetical protein [Acidobacteria bacterium ACB2]MDL1949432.1 hypothetical protein [Acidobacteria bacterium ACD]
MVLGDERGDLLRLCPDWAMKKVDLSLESSVRMEPLRAILEASTAQYRLLGELVSTLERATLRELIAAEVEDLDRPSVAESGSRTAPIRRSGPSCPSLTGSPPPSGSKGSPRRRTARARPARLAS